MISLKRTVASAPRSMCEYWASQDGRFGWFLCTWHPEEHIAMEEIQAEIKLAILNSDIQHVSKLEAGKWLKEFFAEFHWKLHALFNKTEIKEKGISLFLALMYENELHFVQFGRLFCALGSAKSIKPVGLKWENYHVKSLKELKLLGLDADEIKVKVQKVAIPEKHFFLVLPGPITRKLFGDHFDPGSVKALLDSMSQLPDAQWLLLSNEPELVKAKKRKFNTLHIATFTLIFFTIIAILYVIFGNRFFEGAWHNLRTLFRSNKPISVHEIPDKLKIENDKLRGYLEQALKSPLRDVEINLSWNTDLPYQVTVAPCFDLENIYIAGGKFLMAYSKKNQRSLKWKKEFDSDVLGISYINGNILVSLEDGKICNLNSKGEEQWLQNMEGQVKLYHSLKPIELTNADNPRIDGSIIILPSEHGVMVLDALSGEVMHQITFKGKLQYLSQYDSFQSCFYAVVQDAMLCLDLKISN